MYSYKINDCFNKVNFNTIFNHTLETLTNYIPNFSFMKSSRYFFLLALLTTFNSLYVKAQSLLTNVYGRNTTSLNGEWQIIIDPYETGFYDYRFKEKNEKDPGAYWNIIENSDNRILV